MRLRREDNELGFIQAESELSLIQQRRVEDLWWARYYVKQKGENREIMGPYVDKTYPQHWR